MTWEDQGRKEHGYFGNGTSGTANIYVRGRALYYNLPGNKMANGEPFDPNAMAAAMLKVPLGTKVKVTSLEDPSKSIEVTVTDRGPYVTGRVIDLTPKAFETLFGSVRKGIGQVVVSTPERPATP
jgi:rare lipoprotein A